jgi:CrcB protein
LQTTINKNNKGWLDGLVVLGFGSCGAIARYGMGFVGKQINMGFPWGTLFVNLLGCFVLGYLAERWQPSNATGARWKLGVTTGFIGAFTTYSAFAVDSFTYLREGEMGRFALDLSANLTGGFALAYIGVALARRAKAGDAA